MPSAMQAGLDVVLSNKPYDPTGIGMEVYFESYFAELRQSFVARREKLYQDARTFLAEFTAPPRPQLPPLPQPVAVDNLIEHVFAHGNGLVFSEAPKSVASKRLLLLNMPLLAEQRVEVLYIQHLLTDKHLTKLARYRHLGKKSRSGSHEIKHYLHDLNRGALNNASTDYDYYHVIKAAHRYGIEVRPFSSSISYPFDGHPVAGAINDPAAAQKMSNFFGHTLINSDIASARRGAGSLCSIRNWPLQPMRFPALPTCRAWSACTSRTSLPVARRGLPKAAADCPVSACRPAVTSPSRFPIRR